MLLAWSRLDKGREPEYQELIHPGTGTGTRRSSALESKLGKMWRGKDREVTPRLLHVRRRFEPGCRFWYRCPLLTRLAHHQEGIAALDAC